MKKTGPSLIKNQLMKSKVSALGQPYGRTVSCKNGKCKGCEMMSERDFVTDLNDKKYKTSGGNVTLITLYIMQSADTAPRGMLAKQRKN